jgi:hypothetical protein
MKRFALPILSILLISIAMMQPAEVIGQTYKSEEGKFKVKFPGSIDIKEAKSEKSTTKKITCEEANNAYFVGCTIHKIPMTNQKKMAEVSMDSFTESLDGKVSSKEDWNVKGNIGCQAKVSLEEGNAVVHYRVILVGQIQYQVIVTAKKKDYDAKVADKFFKSFKICK